MPPPPANPKIYHITPVENLPSIIAAGGLRSDRAMIATGGPEVAIGMSSIKQRRLEYPVTCHPGDFVGDYVPFYFCPRSVMLHMIWCANHPDLSYRGGQEPIIHLEADLRKTVAWANVEGRRWAFSLSNAGAKYARFRSDLDDLDQIDWAAVAATSWKSLKEGKQAEFLLHEFFPWELVDRIGVRNVTVREQVLSALDGTVSAPTVEIRQDWYY